MRNLAFALYMKDNLPDYESHKLYFDFGIGALDTLYEPLQKIIDSVMINRGYTSINWKTLKFEGHNHTERSWSKRLNEPLSPLLKAQFGQILRYFEILTSSFTRVNSGVKISKSLDFD